MNLRVLSAASAGLTTALLSSPSATGQSQLFAGDARASTVETNHVMSASAQTPASATTESAAQTVSTPPAQTVQAADAPTAEPDSVAQQLGKSVLGGKWWLRLRYRIENVDQDGPLREAWASTLRTVLGYESSPWHGFSAVLEFENVAVLGNEQYNSTVNGLTSYAVVADPEGTEVNQVHLKYVATDELTFKLGRQVITLDNHRFVGDVGWRQNQQTFDAGSAQWNPAEQLKVYYGLVGNVNRVFGDDSPQGDHRMASHLLNAAYDFPGVGKLTGYAYLLDYDSVDTLSTNTFGARFMGSHAFSSADLLYTAEFATQVDAGDNPNNVDQDYLLGELGTKVRGFTLKVGQEVLGGSGTAGDAFQTPLATLHAFNGWADKFLTTPDTGIEDVYVSLSTKLAACDVQVAWHDFHADSGSLHYGTEWDASLTWVASKSVTCGLKYADYNAEDFATDTTKAWFWVSYSP